MRTDSGRDSGDERSFSKPETRPKEPIGRHALGFRLDDLPAGLWAASHVVSAAITLGADDANARQKLMAQLRHLLRGLFFTVIDHNHP